MTPDCTILLSDPDRRPTYLPTYLSGVYVAGWPAVSGRRAWRWTCSVRCRTR